MPARIEITRKEIKLKCDRFGIVYDDEHPKKSIAKVCRLVLSEWDDKKWDKLDYRTSKRIADISNAEEDGILFIYVHKKSYMTKNLKKMVGSIIDSGFLTNKEIMEELDRQGVVYKVKSVRVVACDVRKGREDIIKHRSLRAIIRDIMNGGKGITSTNEVKLAVRKMKEENTEPIGPYTENYLAWYVFMERKRLGITALARRKLKQKQIALELEIINNKKENENE